MTDKAWIVRDDQQEHEGRIEMVRLVKKTRSFIWRSTSQALMEGWMLARGSLNVLKDQTRSFQASKQLGIGQKWFGNVLRSNSTC